MFYLVGSRFFGTNREDSDWDFIGENTLENCRACERMGLVRLQTRTGHVRYGSESVDVCLVNDLDGALWVRNELAKLPNIRELTKLERHLKLKELLHARQLEQSV